jgi:hypothetical protein
VQYKNSLELGVLPEPVEPEEWMATFHIYGDESGKLHQSEYTSFCGYVAHISVWQGFAAAWNNGRFRWQIPPLHMARIMFPDSKDDEWKKVKADWGTSWETKRDAMLLEFAQLVRHSGVACVGAIVDSKHFRLVADREPDFKKLYKDPIYMALHTFVMRGIDKTEVIDKHSPIGIVVDEDEEFAMGVYHHFCGLRKNLDEQIKKTHDKATSDSIARFMERIHAISFVNDASYPGIQAADMIAYEARRLMVERAKNPDFTSELYDELTFLRQHQPKFYTPEVIDDCQASLKEAIANGTVTF